MRFAYHVILFIAMCNIMNSAWGAITVSSYDTSAQANAYAPLDKSAYFDADDHPNTSPATASVSDNWSGTTLGGNSTTWNMIASAQTSSTTAIDQNSLLVTGQSSFSYQLTTSAAFVDPSPGGTRYVPGADSGIGCFFTTDISTTYTIHAQLNHLGDIFFTSSSGTVFQKFNAGTLPQTVNVSGSLPPGQYQFSAGTSQYGPAGLPNGVNNVAVSGSLPNLSFAIQVPEPVVLGPVVLAAIFLRCRWEKKRGRYSLLTML